MLATRREALLEATAPDHRAAWEALAALAHAAQLGGRPAGSEQWAWACYAACVAEAVERLTAVLTPPRSFDLQRMPAPVSDPQQLRERVRRLAEDTAALYGAGADAENAGEVRNARVSAARCLRAAARHLNEAEMRRPAWPDGSLAHMSPRGAAASRARWSWSRTRRDWRTAAVWRRAPRS